MFEVQVEVRPDEFMTWDVRHTKEDADRVAALLRKQKRNTRIIDRDYKKPPREDRYGRGRRDRDDE